MSSTQWGRKAALWAEEQVDGWELTAVDATGVALWSLYLLLVGFKKRLTNLSYSQHKPNRHWNSAQLRFGVLF